MKKNILFIFIGIVLLSLLCIGVSYSLWNMSNSQDTNNVISTAKCFDVSISSQKNSISLENVYSISNENGKKLVPFSFTITNTCDIFASYTVNLESLKDSTLSSKFLDVMINNEEIKRLKDYDSTDIVNSGSVESFILAKGSLGSGDSEDYTLRLWIDYDTTMEDLDNETKVFKGKIIVKSQPSTWDPVSDGYTTLHDAILANEYQSSPKTAVEKIEAKGTPNFSKTAPVVTWKETKSNDDTTITVYLPHPSLAGNESLGGKYLNSESSKINLSTTYELLESSGSFSLTDNKYYVLDELNNINFKTDNYYYCYNYKYSDDSGNIYTAYGTSCETMYKVNKISFEESGTPNTKDYNVKYTISAEKYTNYITENDKSDKGLYQSTDEYGTTYYYRGNINNNYVSFANNLWRIIRINGDNSIRIMLENPLDDIKFNNTLYNPAYVGYMYGDNNGNIGTREYNIANGIDSNIKTVLDKFYIQNIKNKGFDNYIANNGFCGDRDIYIGDGYSTNVFTLFASTNRLVNNKNPSLICPNKNNDYYSSNSSSIGNKKLAYPIGLINIDEVAMAGLVNGNKNSLNWLYNNKTQLTMTPYQFVNSSSSANIWAIFDNGNISALWVTSSVTARPVINLKADVKISGGIGTVNEPFIVDTN